MLLLLATVASAAVAWGCDPRFATRVETICAMHRLQWLAIGVVVASCLSLVGLVVFGKRRAWWLVGLVPIIGMFGWRFGAQADRALWVDDQPAFASVAQSSWLSGDDRVIGLEIDGQAFAYPIAAIGRTPVIVQSERTRRVMVAWSAGANAATACWMDRSMRGRDIEIVAAPAGVLLIYNRRIGEFFDALTLRTPRRAAPKFVLQRIETRIWSWSHWREIHPDTLVLQPRWAPIPAAPAGDSASERVAMLLTDPPIAVRMNAITNEPSNISSGKGAVLVFMDDTTGRVRAFDRRVEEDLFPKFQRRLDAKRKRAVLIDSETQSTWDMTGRAIDGPLKGQQLAPIFVQQDIEWSALKYWRQDAVLLK